MDVSFILRVAGVGLLVAVAERILTKSGREEQGMLVVLAGLVAVFFMLVGEIGELFAEIRAVFGF